MELYKTTFFTTANVSDVTEGLVVSPSDILSCTAKKSVPSSISLENQRDLLKIIAVLVSTGKNRNRDMFLAEEILPARNTGAHKPVDIEHDPKQIIGHMLRTYAALKDGTIIPDNEVPKTRDFDIIAECVLYKFLFPEWAERVREQAQANKLFVSIEVWFPEFDYFVGSKIVKRTSETAPILDPVLTVNGGVGSYEGHEVGRVLRNILIGGIGLVKVPANPASIIKSVSNLQPEDVSNIENPVLCRNAVGDLFDLATAGLKKEDENGKRQVLDEIAHLVAAQRSAAEAIVAEEKGMVDTMSANIAKATELENVEKAIATETKAQEGGEKAKADTEVKVAEVKKEEAPAKEPEKAAPPKESEKPTQESKEPEKQPEVKPEAKKEEPKPTPPEPPKAEVKEPEKKEPEKKEEPKVEPPKVEPPKAEPKTPPAPAPKEEKKEEVVVNLDKIEPVDQKLNLENQKPGSGPSLTEQMGDIVSRFLTDRNKKWEKLALKR